MVMMMMVIIMALHVAFAGACVAGWVGFVDTYSSEDYAST